MRATTLFLALCLVGLPLAVAHTDHNQQELADPGAVPGDLFYALDRAGEALEMGITFSSTAKAKKRLQFAEERLSEAMALADQGREEKARKMEDAYDRNMQRAVGIARTLRDAGDADGDPLLAQASDESARHMTVLEHLEVDPGDTGYDAKRMAEDITVATERDPLERARKQVAAADHRINEMERLAAANLSTGIPELSRAYDREMQAVQDMSDNLTGTNEQRPVNEILARATQRHQQALQDVLDRVPSAAQDAIRLALRVSETGHERAVSALEGSGGLPDGVRPSLATPRPGQPDRNLPATDGNDSRMVEESIGVNDSSGSQ